MSFNTLQTNHEYKKPEVILSFPQTLFADGRMPAKEELYENAVWTTRDFANANQDLLRQAASYVVLYRNTPDGLRIAMYFREKNGDTRLAGKRSIGYGGHPELQDLDIMDENDIQKVMVNSAEREVMEEACLYTPSDVDSPVVNTSFIPDLFLGGLILQDDTPIDRCHVGFMYYGEVPESVVLADGDSDTDAFAGWMSLEDLHSLANQGLLEFWSVTCLLRMHEMHVQGLLSTSK